MELSVCFAMTAPHGSTPGIVSSIAIASMEAAALADQIKINRRKGLGRSEETQQEPRAAQGARRKGAHRKTKRKGNIMSKFKVGMAIALAAHSGMGVVEAE
ncbi:hypothetical protein AB0E08_17950 [Streptomyces sp. NPDC048281]|uniref:hypothetical protein n=1 Tax=Streptomyces sp. NPDC048281 TaxID=3154715 RepID=UPI003426064B